MIVRQNHVLKKPCFEKPWWVLYTDSLRSALQPRVSTRRDPLTGF